MNLISVINTSTLKTEAALNVKLTPGHTVLRPRWLLVKPWLCVPGASCRNTTLPTLSAHFLMQSNTYETWRTLDFPITAASCTNTAAMSWANGYFNCPQWLTYSTVKEFNPRQAWAGPEGSRRFRAPEFPAVVTRRGQGCQLYAPATLLPPPQGKVPGTHFC